ncbi:flavin-containing monooxygenase [Lederbergia galactosidilytica]|uniref:Oxidoreductase n=1 Tax=Lederbergia galactosidilytica TaxID=217031 RepID=A0A177ZVX8_9BACI|nr:NAD(P)/FAD-dependent oxidoreductase [Lederbergia galactosidilytica]OAK70998.1 oxidoreductase [Lederbergia galactosidilytica]
MNFDVVVVGGGQAGLSMGYYLKKENIPFIILDDCLQIGDSWRKRYDSLILFTPRSYCSLSGYPMNGPSAGYPTKDELADYLFTYATHFELPIKHDTKVFEVNKKEHKFELLTSQGTMEAKQVVIAAGALQDPFIPDVIKGRNENIEQMHSTQYFSPGQTAKGSVLIVGGGNSGAQIATELSRDREVTIAISHPLHFLPLRLLGISIFQWLEWARLLYAGIDTKQGSWFKKRADPIFGYELKKLISKNIVRIKQKVLQVKNNKVHFQGGSKQYFNTIIWATGFKSDYHWVKVEDRLTPEGKLNHQRGVTPIQGLYFLGLPWQYQRGSALLCGVGRDAEYLLSFIRDAYY